LNHITKLVEEKKAKFVAIANNVDPIELVVWLPALCRKMNVPYCFVNSVSDLGKLCHQKNATSVAITDVRKEDENDVSNFAAAFKKDFNENADLKKVGGFVKGSKSQVKFDRMEKEKEKETIARITGK